MSEHTVLLAGASGVFGRHVTDVLEGAGHRVLGLGRGPANTIRADLLDREALLAAVRGHRADVVVHAATALARPPVRHRDMTGTDRLRTTGMRNLLEATAEVGATRIVGENMVFGYGYGDHGGTPVAESSFGPHQRDRKLEEHVRAMAEKERMTLATPGLDGISLRFALFYGPGGTDVLVDMLRRRMMPAPRTDGRVLPWVHLRDAARAVLAAIERGTPGEAYTIADDAPTGFGDHIVATAEAFGTPRPLRPPAGLFRPLPMLHAILGTNLRVDTANARRELGWEPEYPSAAEGLVATARESARTA